MPGVAIHPHLHQDTQLPRGHVLNKALQSFSALVTSKLSQVTPGEPEDQLRAPFEILLADIASNLGWKVVCTGETPLPERLGRPDYAIHVNQLLVGYVELKAPGVGATASRFRGRNRAQFKKFSAIPNILYTDGNEWGLYRGGAPVGQVWRLDGDVATMGKDAIGPEDAYAIESLFRDFLSWQPIIPTGKSGKVDLKGLAALLAPLCRMLRDDVVEALLDDGAPLAQLAEDWRQLLFPDAPDAQFADAYAQTVLFALLLARSEGADPLTLPGAEIALSAEHNLLSRALRVLTDPEARAEMAASLDLLLRHVAAVPVSGFSGSTDPWLYFYEDFLASYDPQLRKDAGVYYTPVEVVQAQVRAVDELLVTRIGKPLGFNDGSVITLDPATGTGTYLLGVIDHALERVRNEQGDGAVPGQATELAKRLFGFEIMVGPYAVTELRVSRALVDRGAHMPVDGTHVYLTNTLESPYSKPPVLPLYLKPIAEQHEKALKVKNDVPVIVCLGNPPYDRHKAAIEGNEAMTGAWVRWGDVEGGSDAILNSFLEPAAKAGHSVHVKNLYNLYVYFWRWALWKVFEQEGATGPGVISFITAASFIDGLAFVGMREHMRRFCDDIWIVDLGGEGRGPRKSENVFAIQTPVAITFAVRSLAPKDGSPARVHYARLDGTRAEKLAQLGALKSLGEIAWQDCPKDWQAPFRPAGKGTYFEWPALIDLMPWQHSGVQLKRTWPIAATPTILQQRWKTLLSEPARAVAFRETSYRKVTTKCPAMPRTAGKPQPIADLPKGAPAPPIVRYAFRSFDRQWVVADERIGDRMRSVLWQAHGEHQLYFSILQSQPLGDGPAITVSSAVPDLHHFRGSFGGKDVIPGFRDHEGMDPNLMPGLLAFLSTLYGRAIGMGEVLGYVYGVLAQPAFTAIFAEELGSREIRVPLTQQLLLFEGMSRVGAELVWLHTYGERWLLNAPAPAKLKPGVCKCIKAVPGEVDGYPETFRYDPASSTLHVGAGAFAPIAPEVFAYEVSGLKVVESWLKYRMRDGAGKKSSPLDKIGAGKWPSEFTTELLELLWVLEATLVSYSKQSTLLAEILEGDLVSAKNLPEVPDARRNAPEDVEVDAAQITLEPG